jgi:transposase
MRSSEMEVEKKAAELFVYKGWSIEEIAGEFDLEVARVEQWRRNFSWDEKMMEYLNNQRKLKDYLGALKTRLAQEAFKTLESRKISDMATLLKAEASLVKVSGNRKKSNPRSRQEIARLIREEYGIDENENQDSSSLPKEVAS